MGQNANLVHYSTYSEDEIRPCAQVMLDHILDPDFDESTSFYKKVRRLLPGISILIFIASLLIKCLTFFSSPTVCKQETHEGECVRTRMGNSAVACVGGWECS